MFASANSFLCIIFHHYNNPFLLKFSTFFTQIRTFHPIRGLRFSHPPNKRPYKTIDHITSNSYNYTIIEAQRVLSHIMTILAYFWLKSKIYPEKVPVMTENTLTQTATFISIYAFRDINSIRLKLLYQTQLICSNNLLRKLVDSIYCSRWKQI